MFGGFIAKEQIEDRERETYIPKNGRIESDSIAYH